MKHRFANALFALVLSIIAACGDDNANQFSAANGDDPPTIPALEIQIVSPDLEGHSHREAAELVGGTEDVKVKMHRLRKTFDRSDFFTGEVDTPKRKAG